MRSIARGRGPRGTSEAIIKRLNEEINRVLVRPDAKERFYNQGVEIIGGLPQEVAAFVRSDMATTARIVKALGIRVEH